MAIHDFNFNKGQEELRSFVPVPKDPVTQVGEVVDDGHPANDDTRDDAYYDLREFGDIDDRINVNFVEDIREKLIPGFKQFDRYIKNYFSGIRVPIGKGLEKYRMAAVRVSGADKSSLVYSDGNLTAGRQVLPIIAITRTSNEFDPKRFSPAKFEVARVYKNNMKRVELKYRPVPFNINYTLDIWAEHKTDADFIEYTIVSRFNPIATIYVQDDGVTMPVEMFYNGTTNNSDLESEADVKSEVVYQINLKVEGWLALPSKIVPTILSKPMSIKEAVQSGTKLIGGETYEVITGV